MGFSEKEATMRQAEFAKKEALDCAAEAIKTMRRFLDNAERDLNNGIKGERPVHEIIINVMHEMTWGNANASGSIEQALKYNAEMIAYTARANAMPEGK